MSSVVPFDHFSAEEAQDLDSVQLVSLCAAHKSDAMLWSEFLRRFAPRIRFFIRGTLRHLANHSEYDALSRVNQENDLFQDTVLRLLERDCKVMKRFPGKCEAD